MSINVANLTLVLGGAASGKSAFAERLVVATERPRLYLATAQALDDEMRAKIDRHRAARGAGWRTIEAPLDLPAALSQAGAADIVLLDCATLWLSNHLLADHDPERECSGLMHALAACPAPVVVVSNEIGMSPVPQNAMARIFGRAQGALNRQLAAQAGLVVAVMAGLPLTLKGTLPAGVA